MRARPSYLAVVTTREALEQNPPRNISPFPGFSDDDWQAFLHGDAISVGQFDWYVLHGGPFIADAQLKILGVIPADWSAVKEFREARLRRLRERHEEDQL